jgi:predicted lipid-binding transport protein (Tim44 family)
MSIALSPRRRLATGGLIVAVLAILAVGSFVVLSGAGGDDDSPQRATGGAPPTAAPADPAASPPELKNTGEDWDQIVRSIVAYEHWLFTHPNPDLLVNTELPTNDFFDDRQLGLRNLATKGWRYDPPKQPLPVELVRMQHRLADNVVTVFVRFGPTPATRVVDSAGKVVQETPETPPNPVVWTLVRDPASNPH